MSRKNFSQAHGRVVLPGQVWIRPMGQCTDKPWESEFRVMAVAEGYVMGRHPRAMPYVVTVRDMSEWRIAQGKLPVNQETK